MDSDSDNDIDSATAYKSELPRNMLRYVRKWQLVIGLGEGIYENDITDVGPPRPNEATCKSLLDTIEDACTCLNQCHQVHELLVAVQSNEPGPGNITRILNQIIELRNIRHSVFDVYSEYEDSNLRWNLKDQKISSSITIAISSQMATRHPAAATATIACVLSGTSSGLRASDEPAVLDIKSMDTHDIRGFGAIPCANNIGISNFVHLSSLIPHSILIWDRDDPVTFELSSIHNCLLGNVYRPLIHFLLHLSSEISVELACRSIEALRRRHLRWTVKVPIFVPRSPEAEASFHYQQSKYNISSISTAYCFWSRTLLH
jgi:hypothetical protein